MKATVAVAVERSRSLVLDADYRIVEIGSAVEGGFGHFQDLVVWEIEPAARPLVEPYLEQAWRTGEPVEFVQFFGGRLMSIEAVVRAGRLHVSWEVVLRLDVLTLDALRASLHEAVAIVERYEDRAARRRLHALEGGAS